MVYAGGGNHLVVVNPRRQPEEFAVIELVGAAPLLESGVRIGGDTAVADGFAYGIYELRGRAPTPD